MPSLKKNILANFIGKTWTAVIAIILIPQYIFFLGIESYGLIGFYSTLIGSMAILDMGLSITLNRELAKFRVENKEAKDVRNLVFSLECIYWAIGLIICLIVVLLSAFIATGWVKAENLTIAEIRQSVILMGMVVAFQWPISLYEGGLTGLEKQVSNNVIAVIMSSLKAAGVILILKYFSSTLAAFFMWQAAMSFLHVFILRIYLWKELPSHHSRPRFSKVQLKTIWRFAAGMTSIGIVTFFLSQVDKIVLSKLLPLSQFGYYTLAFTMATSIRIIVSPVSTAFFPRFASLAAGNKNEELGHLYHLASRAMAALIFPVSLMLIFFSRDILQVWTRNSVTTDNTYLMMQILVAGSMFNALMVIPYNIIIAKGWTRFTFYQNAIAALVLVPMLFWWTNLYQALGATFVWLIVNLGYVLISQPLMHRRLLKGHLFKWYWHDTVLQLLPCLCIMLTIKFGLKYFFPHLELSLLMLAIIFLLSFTFSILFMQNAREFLKRNLSVLLLKTR